MSLVDYAKSELDLIGMTENGEDDMNSMMRKHLIHMVEQFADEGHSGFSANYAITMLTRLLAFKPLSDLTGEDSEWTNVSDRGGPDNGPLWQNKRCSSIFKDNEGVWDIDGKVFWEWYTDEEGNKSKSYYTCRDSRVPVTFPYSVPREPIYEFRESSND
jgi:hypothetical protein